MIRFTSDNVIGENKESEQVVSVFKDKNILICDLHFRGLYRYTLHLFDEESYVPQIMGVDII